MVQDLQPTGTLDTWERWQDCRKLKVSQVGGSNYGLGMKKVPSNVQDSKQLTAMIDSVSPLGGLNPHTIWDLF